MAPLLPLLLAPFIGSFLAVLIRRLPAGRPIALARSACESCATPLAPWDMVPLLSHILLRGRCRTCHARIAAQHWHVELAACAVALWAALAAPTPQQLWLDCAFGWTLLALAWIDYESLRLPDALTLPLIPAGLLATSWLQPDLTTDHALAAALAYSFLRLVALAYRHLRHREGLGQGDAKLLAALAAWTGLEALPQILLLAALLGLAAALTLRLRGRPLSATTQIPFGPCLALAGWIIRLHS